MQLINGKDIAEKIYQQIGEDISQLPNKPRLGIILANNDEASKRYVELKKKKAEELGIGVEIKSFTEDQLNSPQLLKSEIANQIKDFNTNNEIDGFLVQLPLSNSIINETSAIINLIDPLKDIDGLTAINLGKISHSLTDGFIPATVEAILECINQTLKNKINWLEYSEENELAGKNVVIVNNSNLIGKPLSNILASKNTSVSILNKHTQDIKTFTEKADIVITATGQGEIFDHTYFKNLSTVIDVTSLNRENRVVGDIKVTPELEKISWLTPVPGGIGPLTVAFLMKNLVKVPQLVKSV